MIRLSTSIPNGDHQRGRANCKVKQLNADHKKERIMLTDEEVKKRVHQLFSLYARPLDLWKREEVKLLAVRAAELITNLVEERDAAVEKRNQMSQRLDESTAKINMLLAFIKSKGLTTPIKLAA
jgi:hypothetical protein